MKKNNNRLKTILIVTVIIVFVASAEALMTAKSSEAMRSYLYFYQNATNNDFINYVLVRYLTNIMVPVMIAIFMFFLSRKTSFSGVHLLMICGVILIGLINIIFTFNFNSIFYYLLIVLNFILLYFVSTYSKQEDKKKN